MLKTIAAEVDDDRPSNETCTVGMPKGSNLSFSVLQDAFCPDWSLEQETAVVGSPLLRYFLELLADRVRVDERWYRATYPDIGKAIEDGRFKSAKHHYLKFGYFENRLAHPIEVDEEFYAENNKDIAAGVAAGRIPSCQSHFEQYGFKEGRLPYENWRLINDA